MDQLCLYESTSGPSTKHNECKYFKYLKKFIMKLWFMKFYEIVMTYESLYEIMVISAETEI